MILIDKWESYQQIRAENHELGFFFVLLIVHCLYRWAWLRFWALSFAIFTNWFSDLIFLDHPLTFGLQGQSSGSSWWITQYYHWSGAAVLASTTLQEHAGSDKAWVWHAPDYSDGTLKEELFCIRFGSIESNCGLLSHLIFFPFSIPCVFFICVLDCTEWMFIAVVNIV